MWQLRQHMTKHGGAVAAATEIEVVVRHGKSLRVPNRCPHDPCARCCVHFTKLHYTDTRAAIRTHTHKQPHPPTFAHMQPHTCARACGAANGLCALHSPTHPIPVRSTP
jgi:hypothetical protein